MSRRWGRTFGLRDRSALAAKAAFTIYEQPEFASSGSDPRRTMDAERNRSAYGKRKERPVSPDPAGRWADEIAGLRKELSKIGKTQLRARAITESALEAIQQTVEAIQTALKRSPWKDRREEAASDGRIKELLTVADGLEEAIRAGEAMHSGPDAAWTDGIRIVHRRVCEILEKEDVHAIASVGETFDPRLHIAVEVEPTSQVAENIITEEHRKGYRLGDQVLRYAEVVVAKRDH